MPSWTSIHGINIMHVMPSWTSIYGINIMHVMPSWTSIHGINIMHVMPASSITMADFRLLWDPCLRERLPLDILSHWDKKSWLSGRLAFRKSSLYRWIFFLYRVVGTSIFRGLIYIYFLSYWLSPIGRCSLVIEHFPKVQWISAVTKVMVCTTYPVCWMVDIKDPLLPIGKSNQWNVTWVTFNLKCDVI